MKYYNFSFSVEVNQKIIICKYKIEKNIGFNIKNFKDAIEKVIKFSMNELINLLNIDIPYDCINFIFYKSKKDINFSGKAIEGGVILIDVKYFCNKIESFIDIDIKRYEFNSLFIHELSHLLLERTEIPLWFEEGIADFLPLIINNKYNENIKKVYKRLNTLFFILNNNFFRIIINKIKQSPNINNTLKNIGCLLLVLKLSFKIGNGWMVYLIHNMIEDKKKFDIEKIDKELYKKIGERDILYRLVNNNDFLTYIASN